MEEKHTICLAGWLTTFHRQTELLLVRKEEILQYKYNKRQQTTQLYGLEQ